MSVAASSIIPETSMEYKDLAALFTGRPGPVQIGPERWCLPSSDQIRTEEIKEFLFKEDDTIVMTMPKSGTTWILEVVWTVRNNADFNHPSAYLPPFVRCPNIEMDLHMNTQEKRQIFFGNILPKYPDFFEPSDKFLEMLRKYPGPRTLKTHLPLQLLSDTALSKAKVVYVIRDPRDTCISYFHHCKVFKFNYFAGTFDQFVDAYLEGAASFCPYWPHVGAAWERRHHPNLHIMFYEHMKKQPKAELHKLSKFLGVVISESQIEKITEYTSFSAMKKRGHHFISPEDIPTLINMDTMRETGGFFRQGTAGGWKEVLTDEQKLKFEAWIEKNCPDKNILENFDCP